MKSLYKSEFEGTAQELKELALTAAGELSALANQCQFIAANATDDSECNELVYAAATCQGLLTSITCALFAAIDSYLESFGVTTTLIAPDSKAPAPEQPKESPFD